MAKRVRILIVDDQASIRQGLRALLTLYPQVELVGEAQNGLEAMQMVAGCRPDVILMDMHMPVVDGLEATQQIKKVSPEIKIIGLTLYGKYKPLALSAGVDVFLLKGCTTRTLVDAILNLEAATNPELVPDVS